MTAAMTKRAWIPFSSRLPAAIACTFSYYGLSQSSTQIAGANPYVSFVVVMSIEIPGNLLAQLLLNRMKRRILLFVAFILAALSIIATQFIPKEYSWLVLLCFVIGKGAITVAFTTLSLYTAEQWPTNIRNTIMNTCSMIGRTGSMLAPFAAILVNWNIQSSTVAGVCNHIFFVIPGCWFWITVGGFIQWVGHYCCYFDAFQSRNLFKEIARYN